MDQINHTPNSCHFKNQQSSIDNHQSKSTASDFFLLSTLSHLLSGAVGSSLCAALRAGVREQPNSQMISEKSSTIRTAKQPDDFGEIIYNPNSRACGRPPHPPRPFLPRPKPRWRRGANRLWRSSLLANISVHKRSRKSGPRCSLRPKHHLGQATLGR